MNDSVLIINKLTALFFTLSYYVLDQGTLDKHMNVIVQQPVL